MQSSVIRPLQSSSSPGPWRSISHIPWRNRAMPVRCVSSTRQGPNNWLITTAPAAIRPIRAGTALKPGSSSSASDQHTPVISATAPRAPASKMRWRHSRPPWRHSAGLSSCQWMLCPRAMARPASVKPSIIQIKLPPYSAIPLRCSRAASTPLSTGSAAANSAQPRKCVPSALRLKTSNSGCCPRPAQLCWKAPQLFSRTGRLTEAPTAPADAGRWHPAPAGLRAGYRCAPPAALPH